MEIVREITAYLENKPGRLAKICSAFAHEKVNIRALSVMDGEGPSVLRLVTDHVEGATKVLTSLGTEHKVAEILAIEIENKPGALGKLLERLAEGHINIEYAYAANSANGKALAILHTSNPKKAQTILAEAYGTPSNGSEQSQGRRPLHSR